MPNLTGDPASHTAESMADGMTGSCLCGSITVILTHPGLFEKPVGHTCHCINCRKFTGSCVATLLKVPREQVRVSDPDSRLKQYIDADTGSGDSLHRCFCTKCGSSVGEFLLDDTQPYCMLNTGIFPRIPQPAFELFTKHRHDWVHPVPDAVQHDFLRVPFKS